MTLWKINCMENAYPGMWQRWYKNQCVAVGWNSQWGCTMKGVTSDRGWSRTRNALQAIKIGDSIVVALKDHRVGRLGQVTGMACSDSNWEPLVPPSRERPEGEMGRRVFVRWELTVGPESRDLVVAMPSGHRFTSGELRPTLCQISSCSVGGLRDVMNEPANWVGLHTQFDYEKALQAFIASYPHRLEDGLMPHPDMKIREKVFKDKSRLDVLLIDRLERPVIVECKRGTIAPADVMQIRHYMTRLRQETGLESRGILVHGGSRKIPTAVHEAANKSPKIEIVRYTLDVDFDLC